MSRTSNSLARRSVTRRRVKNSGVAKLRQAADKLVGENSDKIAESLTKQSLDGKASSTGLLLKLAEGNEWVDEEEAVAKVVSMATIWKNEPAGTALAPGIPLAENREPLSLADSKSAGNSTGA